MPDATSEEPVRLVEPLRCARSKRYSVCIAQSVAARRLPDFAA